MLILLLSALAQRHLGLALASWALELKEYIIVIGSKY